MLRRLLQGSLVLATVTGQPVFAAPHLAQDGNSSTYDYIVVGSGPGGGLTASNLARAGHSVLLIEAGNDESATPNTYISALAFPSLPRTTWQFFARHYADETQELRNNWLTWRWPNGSTWVGSGKNAPREVRLLGNYFPRGNTLGGSAMINAMASLLPNDADWDRIANVTGDASWGYVPMREIFKTVEQNQYLPKETPGHGFDGVMPTWIYRSSFFEKIPARLATLKTIAQDAGQDGEKILSLLESDPNFVEKRDKTNGIFGLPMHMTSGQRRWTPRDLLLATANAKGADGVSAFKLTLQLQSLATKVLFEEKAGAKPRAVGVEFLEGPGIYKATAGYDASKAPKGVARKAYARREVIISGGAFNSPQLLQLSGIGDKAHLSSLGIKLVGHLPGVGQHLMDNQELPVVGQGQVSFAVPPDPAAAECKGGAAGDPCLEKWREGKGWYAMAQGNSEANFITTRHSPDGNRDMLSYAANAAIRAFYLGDPSQRLPADPPTTVHRTMLRMNVQNDGGYVRINSTDPTEVPEINFRYFSRGAESDLGAMVDFVAWNRRVFAKVPAPYGPVKTVEPPCPAGYGADGYCTDAHQDEQWIRDNTYGHHPVGTCKIGADDDPMAVLDSRFRVRGVERLRVVDASAWPVQPGAFPVLPTVLLGQKAAMVILEDAKTI